MPLPAFLPIETPRLTIRLLEERDLPDLLHVNGDSQVTCYLPYRAWQNPEDAQAWYARTVARCADGNAQQVVMALRETGLVIGSALLFRFDIDNERAELGYVLGRAWWGKGFMKETLGALCRHAFEQVKVRRLEAEVDVGNTASNALLRTLGFTCEGTLRERWINQGRVVTTHCYSLLARERQ